MVSDRLARFGSSVFTEISVLARRHGAIDLGQGFPGWEGPAFVKAEAARALEHESNQYPPSIGVPVLREAITERWLKDTGDRIDADANVTVTSGCTEALAATFLGLFEPGDEVILFEPFYDAYPVGCSLAGAVPRFVTLRPPHFAVPEEELRAAFTPNTKAIVVNTPHNPTGHVFSRAELQLVADLCLEHDVIAITDEVYERIVYDAEHLRLATLPGMWERTLTLSSIGKSFSLTGWKTGWAIGPEPLTKAVRAAHQFLTFTTPNPMQYGSAVAVSAPESYFAELAASYRSKRDLLAGGLADLGFEVSLPDGAYYILADHRGFGFADDVAFVHHMVERAGVAAIPPSAFYSDPADGKNLVRFAFCKTEEVLGEALARMRAL
ncbi:MAG: aminotransferase class I/II-fold pyridoxal phosphate-dependent enzyme [Acidimicrobiia bacterium]|nr:aminotransferase class I/II-fold pyridoxal phosphate-dependent enzyme [Acidimicrobiia bacterium]